MKIIFLDIDGVLNYLNYFITNYPFKIKYYTNFDKETILLYNKLLEIDFNKLYLLKELCFITNSKIVVTSSWKNLASYPLIEDYLIKFGLPIIDKTKNFFSNRGYEIKDYLNEHNIKDYIILDDDIFPDFDEELLYHLIHTNFYDEGLNQDNFEDALYKLK